MASNEFDKHLSKNVRSALLELYAQSVRFFDTPLTVTDCKDPKDNKFWALALAAIVKVIVSGNKKDLLVMNPHHSIEIIGLRAFVDAYALYAA